MNSKKPVRVRLLVLASMVIPALPAQVSEPHWTLGFEQRIRNEDWNNVMDYSSSANDEREQIRWRTRFWVATPAKKGISFSVGLDQETNQKLGQNPYVDEIFFETLSVSVERVFVKGLSLRAGRQNMNHGEGFVLMDGTSGDGSRGIYFNGFDLSYKTKNSNLELIGISDPATDRYLPKIHDQHRVLQNWDERAVGACYTDKHLGPATLESYWFYKQETNDRTAVTSAQHQPDRFLNTVGGRASVPLAGGWLAVGEFAAQRGHQVGGKQINTHGGYGYVKRTLRRVWAPYIKAGYVGLSGNDPSRPNVIGTWDPLFSRWPGWSELVIYSLVPENGVAYWTNLNMIQGEVGLAPSRRIKARITYNQMRAFHPFGGSARTFGSGLGRGSNPQGRVDVVLNQYMVAHVLYEYMAPGSFYANSDGGYFLRFETSFLLKNLIPSRKNPPAAVTN